MYPYNYLYAYIKNNLINITLIVHNILYISTYFLLLYIYPELNNIFNKYYYHSFIISYILALFTYCLLLEFFKSIIYSSEINFKKIFYVMEDVLSDKRYL